MRNPALPRTMVDENGQPLSDLQPDMLKCPGCGKTIFNTATCIHHNGRIWCAEWCADVHAIRKLRRAGR